MCSEVCYLHRVRQKKPTALGYPSQTPARKHTQDNMIYKYKISHPRWKEPDGQCLWTGQKYVGTAVGMSKRREKEKENHQKIDDEKGKQKKTAFHVLWGVLPSIHPLPLPPSAVYYFEPVSSSLGPQGETRFFVYSRFLALSSLSIRLFFGCLFFVFFVASRTSSQDVRKREKNETDPNKEREG